MAGELNLDYYTVLNMPMAAVLYLYAAVLERNGEKIGYSRTPEQSKAILNHMREAMNG